MRLLMRLHILLLLSVLLFELLSLLSVALFHLLFLSVAGILLGHLLVFITELLTHTSGLPDIWDNDARCRPNQASCSATVSGPTARASAS